MDEARETAWLDQEDAEVTSVIRRCGWHICYVFGGCSSPGCPCWDPEEGPAFAYTTGLFGLGHPELLVFGLPASLAQALLNEVGERIRSGEDLVPGLEYQVGSWERPFTPESVPNAGAIAFTANRHYGRPPQFSVPLLQLSYPDEAGRYPWQPGYVRAGSQPRPGTFSA
ncbi:MAG: DUF4262 domain-containing protein [Actinomycetes bacterium]